MKKVKVLVIDDEKTSRTLLRRAVEQVGAVAIECSDGERALHLLEDNQDISLVITDYLMPRVTAKELISIVRKEKSEKELPIIVVSGVVHVAEIQDVLKQGVRYFVPKPIDVSMLHEYIVRCFEISDEAARGLEAGEVQ
ncbi:MAG: response regulator [Bdellovibrionales bacterium]|nr:response regulator [Bdellovibrionales bacterium]